MMNNFSFLNSSRMLEQKALQSDAKVLTSVADILNARKKIAKYIFTEDTELTKAIGNIAKIEITQSVAEDGEVYNRAIIVAEDGNGYFARVYGTEKMVVAEQRLTDKEALAKIKVGFCQSGGNRICDNMQRGGAAFSVPRIYINLSELM